MTGNEHARICATVRTYSHLAIYLSVHFSIVRHMPEQLSAVLARFFTHWPTQRAYREDLLNALASDVEEDRE